MTNPLLINTDTPYNTPPFASIKNEHFKPAIKSLIENANGEMGLNTLDAPCIPAVLKTLPDQHLRCGELWAPHCV